MLIQADLTERIIGAAMKVHTELGPGLLESTYAACLQYEMEAAALRVEAQVKLPIAYRGLHLDAGYRLDFLVENRVILELKAVERVIPLHKAQLLSYLRLSGLQVGLLLNFNVVHFRQGIVRMVRSPVVRTSFP